MSGVGGTAGVSGWVLVLRLLAISRSSVPEDICPMASGLRTPSAYGCDNADVDKALTPELRAHRDFIYDEYLELPIVF